MKRTLILILAALALPLAAAETKVTTSGYVDAYYSYNPAGTAPAMRVFDVSDNMFRTSLVGYSVVADGPKTGGRVDLVFGQAADLAAAGNEEHKMFQQAYLTLKAGDASFDLGKFVTHIGYEVIPSKDNANLSRSLLFGYSIPFDHTGLRVSKPLGSARIMACLLNSGWASESSANTDKTVGLQLSSPMAGGTVIVNALHGAELAGDVSTKRTVAELILMNKLGGSLSLGLDGVFGQQDDWTDESVVTWSGVAGYASYALKDDWSLSGRVEQFNVIDASGVVVREGTLTVGRKLDSLLLRAEYRLDLATDRDGEAAGMFPDPDPSRGPVSAQRTVAMGAVYSF
jgi:hypothetical protein